MPSPSLGCIPMVNCIIPSWTGFSWILCKSNPHQHQNKQAENSQDVAVSGLRKCQADTPWKFLLGLKWWVIFCNAIKSEWEYSSSFVRPSPSKFLFSESDLSPSSSLSTLLLCRSCYVVASSLSTAPWKWNICSVLFISIAVVSICIFAGSFFLPNDHQGFSSDCEKLMLQPYLN